MEKEPQNPSIDHGHDHGAGGGHDHGDVINLNRYVVYIFQNKDGGHQLEDIQIEHEHSKPV